MKAKGLIHIHSNFSDGELSLEEIKIKAKESGFSFILLADHLNMVDSKGKVEEMREKCRQLSDENFLLIPGFEIETKEGYHFLIYDGNSGNEFVILAHASQYPQKPTEEILRKIEGIEVWNARYDSRYAPNLKALKYLEGKNLVALIGADAHSGLGLKKLWIELELEKLDKIEIFSALKEKKFKVFNGIFSIDINQPPKFSQRIFFTFVNYFYASLRKPFLSLAKRGVRFPKIFKKIFHKFY